MPSSRAGDIYYLAGELHRLGVPQGDAHRIATELYDHGWRRSAEPEDSSVLDVLTAVNQDGRGAV